jgi:histidinol dehydrogenase
MRIVDWRKSAVTPSLLASELPVSHQFDSTVAENVATLIEQVRRGGVSALFDQAREFDGVTGHNLVVSAADRRAGLASLDEGMRVAIDESIRRVRQASEASLRPPVESILGPGATVMLRWRPVDRAGVYVPGGKAVYPSSVVMNVVAAQVAGVESIALVSPPQADFGGGVHPTILAVAEILGVNEVYAMGGAGAIAALAYGVDTLGLEPVSVITGPGNQYVATAKRLVRGVVGIDSEAGPTEIVIIADASAPVEWMAADLISQAEHDELAQAILITTDMNYATAVSDAVSRLASATANAKRVAESLTGRQSGIFVVGSVDDAVRLSNLIAAEHLEIVTARPDELVDRIRHAGAIFVGPHTPVSAGDYLAGSNHVLPTGRQARFQSGLSPATFMRSQQVVSYSEDALREVGQSIITFAEAEHLPAHADAIRVRMEDTGAGGK